MKSLLRSFIEVLALHTWRRHTSMGLVFIYLCIYSVWVQSWYVLLLNFDNSNSRTENNALILSLLPSVCLQVRKYQKHEISFLVMFIFSLIRYLLIKYCFSFFFWSGKIQGLLLKPYFTFEKKKWYWIKFLLKKSQRIPRDVLCVEYFLLYLLFL